MDSRPTFWSNPIAVWWILAILSLGVIVLLQPALGRALETPWCFQSTALSPTETVRLCRKDDWEFSYLSWEYVGQGTRARAEFGATFPGSDLTTDPIQISRLDPSTILIIDPVRKLLLGAIDTSTMPPTGVMQEGRLALLARAAAAPFGINPTPATGGFISR